MLARQSHIPNIAANERAVLQTCCDLSDEALAECRDIHGAKTLSKDYVSAIRDPEIDAVVIATTEKLRKPVIEVAAQEGKPVYCEKPIAPTLEELYEIQAIVKESGIPFCAGHNRRSSPAMLWGRTLFRKHMESPAPCPWRFDREGAERPRVEGDGVAGMSVRINDDWYSWKLWVFDEEIAGPMLFEMTHFTDLCNWFLDSEPVEVVSLEHGIFNHGAVVRYAGGEIATLFMGANGTFGYPKELYEAFGNGGAVVVDHMLEVRTAGIAGEPASRTFPLLKDSHPEVGSEGGLSGWLAKKRAACERAEAEGDPLLSFGVEPDKGHAHAIERFIDEIRGEGPAVCPIDSAVSATRVAFAAILAAREKRAVQLSEV